MHFYYTRVLGKIRPNLSADHPKEKIDPPRNIVSRIIVLQSPLDTFNLSSLTLIYPYEDIKT